MVWGFFHTKELSVTISAAYLLPRCCGVGVTPFVYFTGVTVVEKSYKNALKKHCVKMTLANA